MKRATIVQQDGVSRGFGFIKFALNDDAVTALKALQGKEFQGRKLKLEIAVQRGHSTKGINGEDTSTSNDHPTKIPSTAVSTNVGTTSATEQSANHLQVVVIGVPSSINKKSFKEAILKFLPFKCKKVVVELLKPEHTLYSGLCPDDLLPSGRVMLLTAPSRKDVTNLVEHLDNVTVKALGLSSNVNTDQKSSESKCKLQCRAIKDITPLIFRKQKCRLIIRNLSFQATEENVATRLLKFGPLVEVTIPRIEIDLGEKDSGEYNAYSKKRFKKKLNDNKSQVKPRGFAFVMFLCEKDASRAVEGSEGLKICNREFALDYCQHKYGYGFANEEDSKEEINDGTVGKAEESLSNENDKDIDNEDIDDDNSEGKDDSASEYSGEEMNESSNDDDASEPGSEMEWDGSDSDDDNESQKKSQDVGNENRTVFVRDLAFDADQADVKRVFRQFGPIEYAVIVLGKLLDVTPH